MFFLLFVFFARGCCVLNTYNLAFSSTTGNHLKTALTSHIRYELFLFLFFFAFPLVSIVSYCVCERYSGEMLMKF